MRDGSLERALALRTLDVDVDPLVIARQLGEAVDHVLRDLDRVAPAAEGVADLGLEFRDVVEADVLHGILLCEGVIISPGSRPVSSTAVAPGEGFW